jgi:hypothetical protein
MIAALSDRNRKAALKSGKSVELPIPMIWSLQRFLLESRCRFPNGRSTKRYRHLGHWMCVFGAHIVCVSRRADARTLNAIGRRVGGIHIQRPCEQRDQISTHYRPAFPL